MNLSQEIANLARFYPNPTTKTLDVQYPNWNEAKELYRLLGVTAQLPDYNDQLWARVHSLVDAEARDRRNALIMAKPRAQKLAAPIPTASSPAGDEARIRSMKGPEVASVLTSLGLSVQPHPTNPGITVMRGKNRLLHYVRQGGSLSVSRETNVKKSKWLVQNS